jgi:hypothetical protein
MLSWPCADPFLGVDRIEADDATKTDPALHIPGRGLAQLPGEFINNPIGGTKALVSGAVSLQALGFAQTSVDTVAAPVDAGQETRLPPRPGSSEPPI